jgi:large repetitive protein
LTNGTPGVPDHEDARTVTVALSGYFFEKTVADITSGANPAATAAYGDKLRYTLRFRNTQALTNIRIFDELDALNAQAYFAPGTLTLVTYPAGADISGTSSTGGAKGTGIIDIRNLNLPAGGGEIQIQFDVTLKSPIALGTVVNNQSTLVANGATFALSDNPNVNGTADPTISGDEDPTRVTIVAPPAGAPSFRMQKISTDRTDDPNVLLSGETLRYTITVKNIGNAEAVNVVLRDTVPANTTYVARSTTLNGVAVADIAGASPLVNGMRINSAADLTPGSMPADSSTNPANVATITFDVVVSQNAAAGTVISNQGFVTAYDSGIMDQPSDDPRTPAPNDPTLNTVAAVNPAANAPALVVTKSGPAIMNSGQWGNFVIDIRNAGQKDAWDVNVRDLLPRVASGGMCDLTPEILSARVFAADGVTPVSGKGPLAAGSGYSLSYSPAPNCRLDIAMSTGAARIGLNERLIIRYRTQLDANTQAGVTLTNVAGATQWFDGDSSVPDRKSFTHTLSNGTPGTADAEDAFGAIAGLSGALFEKTVANRTSGANPAITAAPGDKLRYTLRFRTTNQALTSFSIVDELDALNAQGYFAPGTLALIASPAGADIAGTSGTGGAKGTGLIDVRNLSVVAGGAEVVIQFDITLKPGIANGSIVSNQSALRLANGTTLAMSDDPAVGGTADPTRVTIVAPGAGTPPLYAEKRVVLFVDRRSPGVVDPGDVLRYTIGIRNSAAIPTTGVVLTDAVPANTTYVAGSTILNGASIADAAGGSPIASGIDIGSPGQAAGTISPAATAVLQYDLSVNPGAPAGTPISNQAVVASAGQPNLLTDGDGNPANGAQPTVVVVGAGQQVSISNLVSVVGGGAAVAGAQLDYVVNVVNTAAVPAYNVVITDDLNAPQPGRLAYVNGSATVNGSTASVNFAGSTITLNYGAVNGPLPPGGVVVLRFRAMLSANLALGTIVTNTSVVTWNDPPETRSASVSLAIGGVPGISVPAELSGSIWYDASFDEIQDSGERALAGWTVELYRDNQLLQSAVTGDDGFYRIPGIAPNNLTGVRYELRFRAPGAGPNTAMLGRAVSPFTNGLQRIADILVTSGAKVQGLNLPIHPNGVVYNTVTRAPIAGARLALIDVRTGSPLPAACFDDVAQQGQISLADGYYKFDINFSNSACPSGGDYLIGVMAPAGMNYASGYSQTIPPRSSASTAAFPVPACPGTAADAIPGTALFCEVQASEFAPPASVAARSAGTTYYVHIGLDGSRVPGTSQIFNNHIPLDPQMPGVLSISKSTPMLNVTRGQLVPYVITVNNHAGQLVGDVSIVDRLPVGFSYVKGSAIVDGVPAEPSVANRELRWNGLTIAGNQARTVRLLVAVGAGVSEGEFVNRAQAMNLVNGNPLSGEAAATVRLVPDVTLDCTDVSGKVFNDANRNGMQDGGEDGLAGVRVVTPRGLQATTDLYGRYHITCAITPNESRGSNFVLKLDDRTLPSGFRMTTDQLTIQRATRGKTLRVNFGASIQRVVAVDLSDAAFEPGSAEIRVQWRPRLSLLLDELRKSPAVLRLSYIADTEDEALVKRRVEAVKRQLADGQNAAKSIEHEIFWRRGGARKR